MPIEVNDNMVLAALNTQRKHLQSAYGYTSSPTALWLHEFPGNAVKAMRSAIDAALAEHESATQPATPERVTVERWRCCTTGCNPQLNQDNAHAHSAETGHRVAKWPVRSEAGIKLEQERNRTGYHRKYGRGFDRTNDVHAAHGEDDFQGGDHDG